jgi:hypothetical protein
MTTAPVKTLLLRQLTEGDFSGAEFTIEPGEKEGKFVVKIVLDNTVFFLGRAHGGVRQFSSPTTIHKFCKNDLKLEKITWVLDSSGEQKQSELNLS